MGNYFHFQGRKIVNLGVPYIVFSIVYYVINVTFSSSVNFSYTPKDLLKIYITPIAQYWYLLATLLIFLFLPILEKLIKNYENDELFIIGGKMVYENMLNRVDKLYLTRVAGSHEGNVYFPKINFDEFKLISQNKQGNLTFEVYERKK